MNIDQNKQYLDVKQIKIMLYFLAIVSFLCLLLMKYDMEFKVTMLLPICYFISVHFFAEPNMGEGIGCIAIIIMYAFRMCILPVLCAYGDFWLEPEKSIYMPYYVWAILLNCFEDMLVFGALFYFNQRYRRFDRQILSVKKSAFIVRTVIILLLLVSIFLVVRNTSFFSYFRFITEEEDGAAVQSTVQYLQSFGREYYLLVLIDILIRPLLSFWIISCFMKKSRRAGLIMTIAIGLFNVLIVSDRRIVSLLIGGCCIVQVLLYLRKNVFKKVLYLLMGAMALVTICYCFYGTNEPYLIARKFQRYFSGPSLTAIGIAVNNNFAQGPIVFVKRLFNDSIILTGLFGSLKVSDYVVSLCGSAGRSIWTPMMIGSIQYFNLLGPIAVTLIVCFIIKCDFAARSSNSILHRLMMNYLSISVAVYMVMYTVDLIFYTIIFFGTFYTVVIWLDRKIVWS